MKKYSVLWTAEAACDLQELIAFVGAEHPNNASLILKKIKQRCSKLKTLPERNRIIPELNDIGISQYRELIISPYRIIYKVIDSKVFVLAVIDSRRDLESILLSRLIRITKENFE